MKKLLLTLGVVLVVAPATLMTATAPVQAPGPAAGGKKILTLADYPSWRSAWRAGR